MQNQSFLTKTLYYLRQILLTDLGICILVGISFFITGGFTTLAYSDRLFWVGIGAGILGCVALIGVSLMGRNTGFRGVKDPVQVHAMLERDLQARSEREERYDMCIQLWVIGLTCLGLSALVGALSTHFGL